MPEKNLDDRRRVAADSSPDQSDVLIAAFILGAVAGYFFPSIMLWLVRSIANVMGRAF